jgi:hypothetical protein
MSTDTRSETSVTAVAKFSWVPLLPGNALEDHCEQESTGKRGPDHQFGPVVCKLRQVETAS